MSDGDDVEPWLPTCYRTRADPGPGAFIAVEGISGSGKSTLARLLAARLGAGEPIHVIPAPMTSLTGYLNEAAAALPQLVFYLSGVLHAADLVRDRLRSGPCVTDRYVNSIIANHTAVHRIDLRDAVAVADPMLDYVPRPHLTVYLHTTPGELRRRLRARTDRSPSDEQLLDDPDLAARIQQHYDVLAAGDPSALLVATEGHTSRELADHVITHLRARHAA